METITKKEELLQWLEKVDDMDVLLQIDAIKKQQKWSDTHDFDEEWEKGFTLEEAKAEMRKRIAAYPWKK
ncbi:MAG TPA: hypothetical protein VFM65_08135 [Flavobacteriaceae bacterium]|nr:hypothetical protein [Flavobacteriaceae bacterium]